MKKLLRKFFPRKGRRYHQIVVIRDFQKADYELEVFLNREGKWRTAKNPQVLPLGITENGDIKLLLFYDSKNGMIR